MMLTRKTLASSIAYNFGSCATYAIWRSLLLPWLPDKVRHIFEDMELRGKPQAYAPPWWLWPLKPANTRWQVRELPDRAGAYALHWFPRGCGSGPSVAILDTRTQEFAVIQPRGVTEYVSTAFIGLGLVTNRGWYGNEIYSRDGLRVEQTVFELPYATGLA